MKSARQYFSWIILIAVLLAVIFFAPASSKQAVLDKMNLWVDRYSEAVEVARSDDAKDQDEQDDVGDTMTVRLKDDALDYAGVSVMQLEQSSYLPEVKAQARVENIQPLLQLRTRYHQALSELAVAQVVEASDLAELNRLKQLSQGVAAKKINYAKSQWQRENALLQGLRFKVDDIKVELLQQWGVTISAWVMDKDSKAMARLIARQDSLLLVTLPTSYALADDVNFIRITYDGDRNKAGKAYYVSPALITDQMIQGETYYFKTETAKLRVGMRLDAWFPEGGEPLLGIKIPDEAIVWYGGHQWAYVQLHEGLFQRRPLYAGLTMPGCLFFVDGFSVGETLVISGAQMLLSEEFRWQIQDEDDD